MLLPSGTGTKTGTIKPFDIMPVFNSFVFTVLVLILQKVIYNNKYIDIVPHFPANLNQNFLINRIIIRVCIHIHEAEPMKYL